MPHNLFLILIIGLFNNVALGHEGHDHHSDDNSGSGTSYIPLPERDKEWTDSSIHSLAFKDGVNLKWKDDPYDSKYVIMKMTARTGGYVAVGFCPVWLGKILKILCIRYLFI